MNTIEEHLVFLERFGYPRLSKFDNGWHSNIDVFITGKGIEFTIKSDFGMSSALAAVTQCRQRLEDALGSLSEKVETHRRSITVK